MRIEHAVTSLSWIPSEAIPGVLKLPFERGLTHYDEPPPDRLDDLEALRVADRFRFANHLRAWVSFDDATGAVLDAGYSGGVLMGSTTVAAGTRAARTFEAFDLPTIQAAPAIEADGSVTFAQTAGGRTGLPAPRRVSHKPFVQWQAPLVWSTLRLTIRPDGTSAYEVTGASPFPRHWIYGSDGGLALKTGMTRFKHWYRHAFGKQSPWGEDDSPALVTAAESALERVLSTEIMRGGAKPVVRSVAAGTAIAVEGEVDSDLFLLLDGVVRVSVGGEAVAELGPGAVLGERAGLEAGCRTATVTAVTPCRVAVAAAGTLDPEALAEVATAHRREQDRAHDAAGGGPG